MPQNVRILQPFQGVLSALAALGRIPPKRMPFQFAEPRAEKRMSFRGPLRQHLSVVFHCSQKWFEFSGILEAVTDYHRPGISVTESAIEDG
jgi:hypothetical protein